MPRAYEKKGGLRTLILRKKGPTKHNMWVIALNRAKKNFGLLKCYKVPRAYETLNPGLIVKIDSFICLVFLSPSYIVKQFILFGQGSVDRILV